eukprot:6256859-Prymnesium_polylepis.1
MEAAASGWLQQPGLTFDASTTHSAWRRQATSAISFLESILEEQAMSVAAVAAWTAKGSCSPAWR